MPDGREEINNALEETLDHPFSALRRELGERLSRDLAGAEERAAARSAESARNAATEALELAVRRIRHAASITGAGSALLETASQYCGHAALLVHKGEFLTGWRAGGASAETNGAAEEWSRLEIPVAKAPALGQAIETRDAVVSLCLADHFSAELVDLLGAGPDEKIYLFPLSLRQKVAAILCAHGASPAGSLQPAALGLLCAVTEAWMEVLSSRPPQQPAQERNEDEEAVRPQAASASTGAMPPGWENLSPSERDLHLRAQRFARVLVADLQLYRAFEIREGRQSGDLYERLKEEIDKSRDAYQRKFGHPPTAGIDYFHLELVRTLAGGQASVLGPNYPGPVTEVIFR
jgi:hypothetical protein